MIKRIKTLILLFSIIFISILSNLNVHAEDYEPECVNMILTCYLPTGNPTASGQYPRYGIVAMKREWLGKTAVIYTTGMECIGIFEVLDTGGSKGIKNGKVVDVFVETKEDIIPTQDVIVYLYDAVG